MFCRGEGPRHNIFQKGANVIWLAGNPFLAKQASKDVSGKFP